MRQLLDRINPDHAQAETLRNAALRCIEVAERFGDAKAKMNKGDRYTQAGLSAALREAVPGYAAQLKAARAPIDKLDREVAERRAAMKVKTPDKADLAAAIERAEIRSFLRELPAGERNGLLVGTRDLRILEAALSAPPELSGLAGENMKPVAKQAESNYLSLVYGTEGAAVEALQDVVDEARAIARAARGRIQSESNLDNHAFDGVAGPAEQKAVPWLLKQGNDTVMVCEVDHDGKANYRLATEWEKANGQFFKDLAEYGAAHGDAV